jgi:hypothetical protein
MVSHPEACGTTGDRFLPERNGFVEGAETIETHTESRAHDFRPSDRTP